MSGHTTNPSNTLHRAAPFDEQKRVDRSYNATIMMRDLNIEAILYRRLIECWAGSTRRVALGLCRALASGRAGRSEDGSLTLLCTDQGPSCGRRSSLTSSTRWIAAAAGHRRGEASGRQLVGATGLKWSCRGRAEVRVCICVLTLCCF